MDHQLAADPAVVNTNVEQAPPATTVFRLDTFINEKGQAITAKYALPPDGQFGVPVLYEFTTVYRHMLPTPQGAMPIDVDVVIPGETPQQAFANFEKAVREQAPELVRKRVEELKAAYQRATLAAGARAPIPPPPLARG